MRRTTMAVKVVGLLSILVGWACAGADSSADSRTVPDPTGAPDGVRAVRHDDPTDREDLPAWGVVQEPVLRLGAGAEDGFGLVAGAIWLRDGTIAAADAHSRHVRLFGPDGTARGAVGRRGGGPGEFESIDAVWSIGEDSVGLFDLRMMRVTAIDFDGEVGRTTPLELTGVKAHPSPLATLDDGTMIAMSDGRTFREGVHTYRSDVSLLAYAPDGSIARTIAEIPGQDMWNFEWDMGVTPSAIPFGRSTLVAADGDGVWVGTNEGYTIDRYRLDGSIALRLRLSHRARPLDPRSIRRYRQREREKAESPGAAAKGPGEILTLMAEAAPYPDTLPAYDAMLVDDDGHLWVRDYTVDPSAETSWTVFADDGRLVATAHLPARFRPTAIRARQVLGVWTDELDVEQVRVYELAIRAPGGTDR